MREAQERNSQGIPVPDRSWKLGDWLDYWLEHVVAPNRRPATYRLYEMIVRLYLKPALGTSPLTRVSAARVQAFLNGQLAAGRSIRQVQFIKTVLSSALARDARGAGFPERGPAGRAACLGPPGHRDALGKISEALGGSHRTGS
jgi:hypothetical protein